MNSNKVQNKKENKQQCTSEALGQQQSRAAEANGNFGSYNTTLTCNTILM